MAVDLGSAEIARTRRWLERAVIGLNLCPFARAPHVGGRIRWVLSAATDREALLLELEREMAHLRACDPAEVETTLLIHPQVLLDFLDYNDFLDEAEDLLAAGGHDGELQIASFHPQYQFAGTAPDDIGNCTNRSPYPMLHLLRERSISRVLDAGADVDAIIEHNQQRLRQLGAAGWTGLLGE